MAARGQIRADIPERCIDQLLIRSASVACDSMRNDGLRIVFGYRADARWYEYSLPHQDAIRSMRRAFQHAAQHSIT
jgi:hypothetical protein